MDYANTGRQLHWPWSWYICIPSSPNFCYPKAEKILGKLWQRASIFWFWIQIMKKQFSALELFTLSHKKLLPVSEQTFQYHKSKISTQGHAKSFYETHQARFEGTASSHQMIMNKKDEENRRENRLRLLNGVHLFCFNKLFLYFF